MKKTFCLLAVLFVVGSILAQVPQKMSYQAVIRNASNVDIMDRSSYIPEQ